MPFARRNCCVQLRFKAQIDHYVGIRREHLLLVGHGLQARGLLSQRALVARRRLLLRLQRCLRLLCLRCCLLLAFLHGTRHVIAYRNQETCC